jgi:RecA-family ATPase
MTMLQIVKAEQTSISVPVGLYTAEDLDRLVKAEGRREFLIDGMFTDPSFNILVGDSGLGKTALALSAGVAVASGKPWLNRAVKNPGPVIYFNGEMTPGDLQTLVVRLSQFAGLAEIPKDLLFYSPNWEQGHTNDAELDRLVRMVGPRFVVVDPLRVFFPGTDSEPDRFNALFKWARGSGATVLLVHHRRKHNKEYGTAPLVEDAHGWLQETVGLGALINLTDTRLGMDVGGYGSEADVVVGASLGCVGISSRCNCGGCSMRAESPSATR